MISQFFYQHPYAAVALIAFLVNIPLGYIRENYPKFSFIWLFWIHASIPLLVYLRIKLEISSWFLPLSIVLVVVGQIIGSRWRLRTMSAKSKAKLQQVPEHLVSPPRPENIEDGDVLITLLNMGGPKTNADVLDFQRRLFNDPLLIRFPLSFLFQSLFAWLLITFRGKAAQKRYQLIGGGSPIYESTQQQVAALQEELQRRGRHFDVIFSFNYSPPFPAETIEQARQKGKKYLLPLSLYPHYSKATTGSNLYYLKQAAKEQYPSLQFLSSPSYYLHDQYIRAFVERIYEQVKPTESLDEFYLLFSAHGLPLYFLTEGDLYAFQVAQTIAKILTQLKRYERWVIGYQSAVGPLQWLKPSLESILEALAKNGITKVLIVPVSFVSDHIETLCEIDIEYRRYAAKLGIKNFRMARALEIHPRFICALADAVESVLPRKIKITTANRKEFSSVKG